jgi:hypothetical protein
METSLKLVKEDKIQAKEQQPENAKEKKESVDALQQYEKI